MSTHVVRQADLDNVRADNARFSRLELKDVTITAHNAGGATSSAAGQIGGPVTLTAGAGGDSGQAAQNAGAGGSVTFTSGGGGVADAGTANGGAGGAVALTGAAGGSSAGGTGGAGGTATITAGAGGTSTTGTGGAGGSINLVPAAGGVGDTAGTDGTLQVNSSAAWFTVSGTISGVTDTNVYVFAVPNGVRYRVAGVTANCSADNGGATWGAFQSASGTALSAGTAITAAGQALTANTSVAGTLSGTAANLELVGAAAPLQVGVVLNQALEATETATFTFHLAPTV